MKDNYDVIIVGSGIAGLTVALCLSQSLKVLLATKASLADGATNLAQGGIAGVVSGDDSIQEHVADTLVAGDFHNDQKAVTTLSKKSQGAIAWLRTQGVHFDENDGQLQLGMEAGHHKRRILHIRDHTGAAIESALIESVRRRKNITVVEQVFCKDLVVSDGRCVGVELIIGAELVPAFASNTVLATGGLGQIYQWTTNPNVATGDGIAIASRVGVELKDLEFVQFHPTALAQKTSPLFLISETVRGEGGYIVDAAGRRFLFDTLHDGELAPRDEVSRAIFAKQQSGSFVYLDVRHLDAAFFRRRFPTITKKLRSLGLDPNDQLIPITPAAHYLCGGIKTDLKGRTSLPGLYAVGEVASTGVHGANRLASNSLLEGVVFGRLVAQAIVAGKIIATPHPSETEKKTTSLSQTEVLPHRSVKLLQKIMWKKVGIMRNGTDLIDAYDLVGELDKKTPMQDFELKNMLLAAKCLIESCLARKKSLGAHFIDPQ